MNYSIPSNKFSGMKTWFLYQSNNKSILFSIDKAFKFGISWDVIRGFGKYYVFLLHFGPFVLSFGWMVKPCALLK